MNTDSETESEVEYTPEHNSDPPSSETESPASRSRENERRAKGRNSNPDSPPASPGQNPEIGSESDSEIEWFMNTDSETESESEWTPECESDPPSSDCSCSSLEPDLDSVIDILYGGLSSEGDHPMEAALQLAEPEMDALPARELEFVLGSAQGVVAVIETETEQERDTTEFSCVNGLRSQGRRTMGPAQHLYTVSEPDSEMRPNRNAAPRLEIQSDDPPLEPGSGIETQPNREAGIAAAPDMESEVEPMFDFAFEFESNPPSSIRSHHSNQGRTLKWNRTQQQILK
jgi:hypothetical protein